MALTFFKGNCPFNRVAALLMLGALCRSFPPSESSCGRTEQRGGAALRADREAAAVASPDTRTGTEDVFLFGSIRQESSSLPPSSALFHPREYSVWRGGRIIRSRSRVYIRVLSSAEGTYLVGLVGTCVSVFFGGSDWIWVCENLFFFTSKFHAFVLSRSCLRTAPHRTARHVLTARNYCFPASSPQASQAQVGYLRACWWLHTSSQSKKKKPVLLRNTHAHDEFHHGWCRRRPSVRLDQVVQEERPGRVENVPGSVCDAAPRAPHGRLHRVQVLR